FAADEITDGKITLSFGKYEGTKEIDVSEVLEDKSKHGERMIADEYIKVDGATKWVVVPYTVITKKIATAADLDALIPSAGTSVYGYYLVTADIDYTSTNYHGFFGGWDDTGAFRGTLDGNGKTITLNSKAHIGNGNGLFGKADGATVKNVNFVETGYDFTKRGRAVFAKAIYNTTFSDINFKITGAVDLNEELTSAISDDYGIFAFGTIQMCTFKNINIDASEVTDDKGATGPLQLGAVIGKAGGWIVIDNFSVYAAGVVEAYHMAQQADIHRMGRDDGAFKGFINVITPEKLDKQVFAVGEIENDTITLSLDKYNGGTVTKGTNVINVANVIADETKHGAEYTAVFYITVDGAEKWVVIPYSVVTAKIDSVADFITIMPTAGSVTGYYYMTADVDLEAAWTNGVRDAYSNVQKGFSWASGNAFKGTLDGNGKTITVNTYKFNNEVYNFAMFGALNGATIKNLNVTDKRFDCNSSAKGLFAKGVYDTTFDNVNINIVGANALDEAITTVPGEDSGIFGFGTIQRATFKNITVNALDVTDASGARGPLNIGTVIGKVSAPVVIENFNVYAASVIEAYHLAGAANRHYLGRDGDGYK
ncbi:MAG: hypothetical protein IJ706_04850, partial [Clostridia bacterium]|nr:hypothetical protein [Clostridia bacterium]